MTELSDDEKFALSTAAQAMHNHGIPIACPWEGDLDDLELERFAAMVTAIHAYNVARRNEPGTVKGEPLVADVAALPYLDSSTYIRLVVEPKHGQRSEYRISFGAADALFHELAAMEGLEDALVPSPSGEVAEGYVPQVIEFTEGGYAQLVLEDTATLTAEDMTVQVIRRLAEPREIIGFQWPLAPTPQPDSQTLAVEYDGFIGTVQGSYVTREGKRGVVLQQVGTKVVHVYGADRASPTQGGVK